MTPLPIAGIGNFVLPAATEPENLRGPLLQVCPQAPRRLNRLIQLGLIGAHRAAAGRTLPPDTPLYIAFSHGSIANAKTLVQDTAAGRPAMPITFINVSSNMTGFYIAGSFALDSSNQVVASQDFSWEATLELAALGGSGKRCTLIGAVEECAWPLPEHHERLRLRPDAVILECSHWLLVDREAAAPKAEIRWVKRFATEAALTEFLRTERWPAGARVALGAGLAAEAARWLGLTQLPQWQSALNGYSGLRSATDCCQFLAEERGALLHLNRGAAGDCYAVLLNAN